MTTQKPNALRFFAKLIPPGLLLVVMVILATPFHEAAHYLVGTKVFGADGYVEFTWTGGSYYWTGLTTWQHFWTRIAGGLAEALVFGILWAASWWQSRYSRWELDDTAVYGLLTVFYFIYAWFDGLGVWIDYGTLIGMAVAFTIIGALYGKRLVWWVFELNGATASDEHVT